MAKFILYFVVYSTETKTQNEQIRNGKVSNKTLQEQMLKQSAFTKKQQHENQNK